LTSDYHTNIGFFLDVYEQSILEFFSARDEEFCRYTADQLSQKKHGQIKPSKIKESLKRILLIGFLTKKGKFYCFNQEVVAEHIRKVKAGELTKEQWNNYLQGLITAEEKTANNAKKGRNTTRKSRNTAEKSRNTAENLPENIPIQESNYTMQNAPDNNTYKNIDKTTTNGLGDSSSSFLLDDWKKIHIPQILKESCDFGSGIIDQLKEYPHLTPQNVQDSLNYFAFKVRWKRELEGIKKDATSFFIGIMRKRIYTRPSDYKTDEDIYSENAMKIKADWEIKLKEQKEYSNAVYGEEKNKHFAEMRAENGL
jgi:hypothetical protein